MLRKQFYSHTEDRMNEWLKAQEQDIEVLGIKRQPYKSPTGHTLDCEEIIVYYKEKTNEQASQ